MAEEWKEMKNFGDWLLGHGISCAEGNENISHSDKIWEQRVGITLVHQAVEILMKSYLVKQGVSIIGTRNRTIEFLTAFDKINFLELDKNKFKKFNDIRNEIYHHSFKIPWEKDIEIQNFLEEFKNFYKKGFDEYPDFDKSIIRNKFKRIHE